MPFVIEISKMGHYLMAAFPKGTNHCTFASVVPLIDIPLAISKYSVIVLSILFNAASHVRSFHRVLCIVSSLLFYSTLCSSL